MTPDATTSSPPPSPAAREPSQAQVLRRLFLMLFLRGRSSRGLQKEGAPKSVGRKLGMTLLFYGLFGFYALLFLRQPVFALSAYLHGMTFMFLGMFVAASAGEVLFNNEEADILLHRPVDPKVMLWAKVRVLVEISLWLAFAFNFAGIFTGIAAPDGGWRFPLVHAFSTVLEALFCCGCVVLVYQLCLRWFGRQRLEGLMTIAQVAVAIGVILSSQLLPQLALRADQVASLAHPSWWLALVPPAWFAGLDDALAGSAARSSWLLAAPALLTTAIVLWLAFGKLAHDYQTGLQSLGETVSAAPGKRSGRRWLEILLLVPPWRWWCREPVARASFLLTAAYLARDRDVKLRIYPGLAPILVMPVVMLMNDFRQGGAGSSGFGIAFSGAYLGLIPFFAIGMLQYSQQWQASDVFRAAPLPGPGPLCHGARRAVLSLLTVPMALFFGLVTWLMLRDKAQLLLLIPGVIVLPVYALMPGLLGAVPLSRPIEEAKAASRGMTLIGVMLTSFALAGVTILMWHVGWFWWFVAVEAAVAVVLYAILRCSLAALRWPTME